MSQNDPKNLFLVGHIWPTRSFVKKNGNAGLHSCASPHKIQNLTKITFRRCACDNIPYYTCASLCAALRRRMYAKPVYARAINVSGSAASPMGDSLDWLPGLLGSKNPLRGPLPTLAGELFVEPAVLSTEVAPTVVTCEDRELPEPGMVEVDWNSVCAMVGSAKAATMTMITHKYLNAFIIYFLKSKMSQNYPKTFISLMHRLHRRCGRP